MILVIRSDCALIFVKSGCHTNPVKKNKQGRVHISENTYFQTSRIHQLTIMYHFEHTNYDTLLDFLF